MKNMNVAPLFSGIALALALLGMSGEASAAGAALDASTLDTKTRTELRAEIDKARVATPELFKAVESIALRAREIDAAARAPGIPFTMHFKSLGQRALYPMLDVLVFDSHTAADLPETAKSALRIGLIEAIGGIRDARAIPILSKLLDAKEIGTVRATSEALSRIGTDEALNLVFDAASKARSIEGNDRERAILSGIHDGRREIAARFLARRLRQDVDADTARVVMKALGGVGNAWAWKTLSSQAEMSATRSTAASALVDAYVRFFANADVREAAAKAILVVDDPSTPSLIAQAKQSSRTRDEVPALEALEKRFANNPSR